MSRKIYIGEDNLINLKNAMAGKNIGHNTFMQEDKPPYEKDEFTINPEGGANDNFRIGDDAINEHHLDQRLPFDENEFSRKRYIEQYVDWLEEFGRYGELPNGSLDFWEEIAKAVKVIREKSLHGRFDSSLPLNKTDEEIVEELKNEKIGPYLKLEGGKVYVERAINIDKSPKAYYNGKDPKNDELYTKLINAYNDNVGGCWSYKKGGAQAYCSMSGAGYKILLCGFIRTDDIDFIKTVQLNYHYPSEHEIRVNPFAKIELEGIGYNSSSYIPFDRHLIVSATYSGNNSKSNIFGYTKVDDGFGGIKYLDRNRQEFSESEINKEIMNRLANGEINMNFFDYVGDFHGGIAVVSFNGQWNFVKRKNGKLRILSDKWYNYVCDFQEGFGIVQLDDYKWNLIKKDGEILRNDLWFDKVTYFYEGFSKVLLGEKYNYIKKDGEILRNDLWFDDAYYFRNGLAKVQLDNKWNYIKENGELLREDIWFDYIDDFINDVTRVVLNLKWYSINKDGKLSDHNFAYISRAFDADGNEYFSVENGGQSNRIDINGNLIPVYESKNNKKIIMSENKLITIKENLETEVEANEVSLDSFKKQKELAPKIWNGDKLNSRVRLKLLDIADDFWETTDIGWVKPKGIVLMGSICNYNWSKSSDIDLHLQVDFSEVDEKKDFVQEYFNGKKNEWNEEHSNLKIFGFPVELYVEDIDADTNSGGIYDLEENDWIKKPSKNGIKQIGLDKYSIKDKSAKIMTDIDDLYDLFKKTDDDAKLRKIGEKAHNLLGKIKTMRKDGLSRGGESDKDNIVYKVLRRTGYMDILWNLSSQLYDKLNSIDESNILEIAERYIRASLNEEVVADGNADHNPFKKRWKYERETLINYLTNYGEIMTSKENGKQYKVLFDDMLSNRIGLNYCLCIQWNPMTMEPGNVIYVRALDKFTRKIFKPEFDTRGFDNIAGTYDDVV